ncbi:hypothetical protein WNY59_02485 [Ahrensia kielensis]|uniref:Uncharacterized protein n=1 Tax=Ahrensia kielensis TaxID=76980 RepID=A0ABU9T2U1_9HYPH
MNWRTEIQLTDIGEGEQLEVTCRVCGHTRYEDPQELAQRPGLEFAYLDEAEAQLVCYKRGCRGRVRLALTMEAETEGFVGGLA